MIDYCTIIATERELEILPLHLNSLKHYSGDFNLKVSVAENLENHAVFDRFDIDVLFHPTYTQLLAHPGLRQAGFDCANRMDKLMQACTSDWVILSQLDIIWKQDVMPKLRPLMTDEYGMIGIWPHGCTVVNRNVYEGCHHAFWPNGGWLGRIHSEDPPMIQLIGNREGSGQPWWKIGSGIPGHLINIDGVDVGMLIKMEMQGYGYNFNYGGVNSCYHHIGGVSFHGLTDGDEAIKKSIIAREQHALDKYRRFR